MSNAMVNISNYVRDGAKLGAMGMMNTVWVDDGENLFAYNWHGLLWVLSAPGVLQGHSQDRRRYETVRPVPGRSTARLMRCSLGCRA